MSPPTAPEGPLTEGVTRGPIPDMVSGNTALWVKGAVGTVAPLLSVVVSAVEGLEPYVKLAALILGGIAVPIYTILSIRRKNKLLDAQLKRVRDGKDAGGLSE